VEGKPHIRSKCASWRTHADRKIRHSRRPHQGASGRSLTASTRRSSAYVVYSQALKGAEYQSDSPRISRSHAGEELAHAIHHRQQIDYSAACPMPRRSR
jgi:hypothetical protein